MTSFMSIFTSLGKTKSRKKTQVPVQIVNEGGERVMVSNEEYSSRYSDTFFVQHRESCMVEVNPGTLLYIWQQNTMIGDFLVPETPGKQIDLQIHPGGKLVQV